MSSYDNGPSQGLIIGVALGVVVAFIVIGMLTCLVRAHRTRVPPTQVAPPSGVPTGEYYNPYVAAAAGGSPQQQQRLGQRPVSVAATMTTTRAAGAESEKGGEQPPAYNSSEGHASVPITDALPPPSHPTAATTTA